jgi:hypothetical protein
MKATDAEMERKFMALSANRADELAKIYGGPGAESLDRGAQWKSILEDAPANRLYLVNALGLGHDGAPAEEPAPSKDDQAAAIVNANPLLVSAEIEAAPEKVPAFGHRTDEQLSRLLYGRSMK